MITERMATDLNKIVNTLNPFMKLSCCQQIASAVNYLHSFDPPVLHRDLKLSNVLIDKNGVCKLADFGVSRLGINKFKENTMTKGKIISF